MHSYTEWYTPIRRLTHTLTLRMTHLHTQNDTSTPTLSKTSTHTYTLLHGLSATRTHTNTHIKLAQTLIYNYLQVVGKRERVCVHRFLSIGARAQRRCERAPPSALPNNQWEEWGNRASLMIFGARPLLRRASAGRLQQADSCPTGPGDHVRLHLYFLSKKGKTQKASKKFESRNSVKASLKTFSSIVLLTIENVLQREQQLRQSYEVGFCYDILVLKLSLQTDQIEHRWGQVWVDFR